MSWAGDLVASFMAQAEAAPDAGTTVTARKRLNIHTITIRGPLEKKPEKRPRKSRRRPRIPARPTDIEAVKVAHILHVRDLKQEGLKWA